ncbi:MAG: hypothetical protein NC826_01820 [Candidatus Omnitrophica bacterium]|nr:hypothetical protein [Candidatus Omnitrophota bacterium]
MERIKVKVGNICIEIRTEVASIKKRIKEHYKDFLSQDSADLLIDVQYGNFLKPKFKKVLFKTRAWELGKKNDFFSIYFFHPKNPSWAKFNAELNHIRFFTKDPSGQLLLYLFPEILFSLISLRYQTLMLHACGILNNKKGHLFVAQAKGGKSTLAKLALKRKLTVLNDDRIVVTKKREVFKIYGTPWHGDVENTSNKYLDTERILFLKKANFNKIQLMDKKEALIELLQNNFCLTIDSDIIKRRFNFCLDLVEKLKCYRLYFKADESIWEFLDGYFK